MAIKNIIFDLGGVLLNLAPERTTTEFQAISGSLEEYQHIFKKLEELNIFNDLEVGAIDGDTFLNTILAHIPSASTAKIRTAWSAMLLDFPSERVELLKKLKTAGYNLYLLSNTNSLHMEDVRKILQEAHQITDFNSYFKHAYYSHEIGFRKPNTDIYQYVLDDAQLIPQETVFIEDTPHNLVGAKEVGMNTLVHPRNGDIAESLFDFLDGHRTL